MNEQNINYTSGATNNITTGGSTYVPCDDGICHCEICPCCGKPRRRKVYPTFYPEKYGIVCGGKQ